MEMEDWVGSSASVRHRRGFSRDTDLDTIGRYKHTDLGLALGEVDEGRAGDVQMVGMLESPVSLPVRYKGSREGCNVDLGSRAERLVMSNRRGCYNG